MKVQRKRLGDLLVEAGLITERQLEAALLDKTVDQRIGDVLLQKELVTERQLIEVLEFQLGIPHYRLYQYPFDTTLFSLIPKEVAKRNELIPLKKERNKLFVAMVDPMDMIAIEDLRLSTGFQIEPAIASRQDITQAITKYYDLSEEIEEISEETASTFTGRESLEDAIRSENSPVVRLVNQLLLGAINERASDIHIDPQESAILVRYRVDGQLRTERSLPKHMQNVITARMKILANLNITETRAPQDGRIKKNVNSRPVDMRISTLPTVFGEKIVLRILDLTHAGNDLELLGFGAENLRHFRSIIQRPSGIVLITGPTGSGKSSTLYAALHDLNDTTVNIMTIEDPVEYQLEGINQIQVNQATGMTFAKGLRAVLRGDPNIIMVGEIRDKETVEVAIRASLTGHLVLSTLHTNDAISTIVRLVNMGVEPFLVASAVSGIVSQRLVRKVCRDCGEPESVSPSELDLFHKRGMTIHKVMRGKGCPSCNMTGYKGRLAVQEVLVIDDEMKQLILHKESMHTVREYAIKKETLFLLDDGLRKVKQGVTTTEEILRVAMVEE